MQQAQIMQPQLGFQVQVPMQQALAVQSRTKTRSVGPSAAGRLARAPGFAALKVHAAARATAVRQRQLGVRQRRIWMRWHALLRPAGQVGPQVHPETA